MKTRVAGRKSAAFVLVEVLFAIFLITAGAFIVAATMPISNVSRQEAMYADKAMDLAQKQMEAIRAGGFSDASAIELVSQGLIDSPNPVATNTYTFTNSDSANLDNPALVLPSGTGTVKIENLTLTMTRITVTVNWSDSGVARTYSIGTLIANL
jgi:competence protein ComGC